jgi:hypothetical protein
MCSRLSQRVVNEPSTRAASGMMRCKQWWQQSGVYSTADWSVNSTGAWSQMASQHATSPGSRHIPRRAPRQMQGRAATYRLPGAKMQIHSDSAGVILSHSQPVLCPHVQADLRSLPRLSRLKHASLFLSLFIHCAFAGAGSLATLLSPCTQPIPRIRLFALDRSSTASRIRHKLFQCPRRREARCRAARSRRPRHRMYIQQAASQRG